MSFLLVFVSILLSFFSACMMAYNAMATQIAPWVAPVVSVTIMIILLKIVQKEWFKESVVVGIAAGSIGGMIGMCLGLSWPTLYFLEPITFASWMSSPKTFAFMVSSLVFSAGSLAFVIVHLLRHHLIVNAKMNFPMSTLVHSIIYTQEEFKSFALMMHGLMITSSWNVFTWISRVPLHGYLSEFHTIPVFLSIGFVAGQIIAIPLLIGLFSRILIIASIQQKYFYFEKESSFILTFALGMIFAIVAKTIFDICIDLYYSFRKNKKSYIKDLLETFWYNSTYRIMMIGSLVVSSLVLTWWKISYAQQCYMILSLFVLSHVVGIILAEVGVLEIPSFVNFIILPITYFFTVVPSSALIMGVFATICIGLVVDLLFSYKLAHLAEVAHEKILKYQILGFFVAACTGGFILWWYMHKFHLGSSLLLAQQAAEQEAFVTFQQYNYQVLIAGFVYALFLQTVVSDMLVVISGFLMPLSMSFWLILAGGLSYLVQNRKQWYPFWFGVYASHALWIFARSIILQI